MFSYLILFTCLANARGFDVINVLRPLISLKRVPGNTVCVQQLNTLKDDLMSGSNWAIQMIDASSKLQSGIMEGNLIELGQFDQCMNVNSEGRNIRGKYCLARMPIAKIEEAASNFGIRLLQNKLFDKLRNNTMVGLVWGLCIPDGCSAEEVTNLTGNYLEFAEYVCQTADDYPKVAIIDYVALGFFATIFGLILASTLFDLYLHHFQETTDRRLFLVFSFFANGKHLFKKPIKKDLAVINGMRSISILWIIFGHMSSHLHIWGVSNTVDIYKFITQRISMILVSAHMAVDTFIFLSGLLVAYTFLKAKTANLLMFYLHRYCRLTPALAVMILLHLTIIKFVLYGPLGPVGNVMYVQNCERYWWSSLLYTQNWINPANLCAPISWYLSVDMQLYLFAPLILFPLKKYPKQTLIAASVLACVSTCITFCVVWIYKIEAMFNIYLQPDDPFTKQYYYQTYTRASPWFIGVIAGYYIYQAKYVQRTVNFSKKMVLFLWILSLAVIFMCIFGGHELLLFQDEYDPTINSAYLAFVKVFWSIALSWIVYACATGNGGPINWFLSLEIFRILATLSYSMYLLHYTIFGIMLFNKRTIGIFSLPGMMYDFCGHCAVIAALSALWYLSFESPFIALESYLMNKFFKKNEKLEEKNK